MTEYKATVVTRITAVRLHEGAVTILFDHPDGVPIGITGYLLGEDLTKRQCKRLVQGILAAAGATRASQMTGKTCELMLSTDMQVVGLVFPDTKLFCYFPDYL